MYWRKIIQEITEDIVKSAKNYVSKIKKLKLRSWLLEKSDLNWLKIVLNKLILLLGFPIFLFGFIFNAAPFFIIDSVTRKKIKDKGFWSTFYLVLGIILFPIFYLIEFLPLHG